jgi:hypothetical protein
MGQVRQQQGNMLIFQFLKPVAEHFLDLAKTVLNVSMLVDPDSALQGML